VSDVTRILDAIEQGDARAVDELLPTVYQELRRLAADLLSHERPGHTLQATALVHEAYVRLVGSAPQHWDGRRHFLGAAAEAMRRILVESARRKHSAKRGGQSKRVDLDDADIACPVPSDELLALDEALDRLAVEDPSAAELVKLRYFAGLTSAEAADALDISPSAAKRLWSYARAWLRGAMREAGHPPGR
jgi:RNA polymerase sigma factor (TIGR02999 family)